jgi:hypothetical protein
MPAKLPEEWTAVKLRLFTSDLDLIRALHESGEGGVNGFVRDLLHAYAERMRVKLAGRAQQDTHLGD